METAGKTLRDTRKERKETLSNVCDKVGLSRMYLSDIENGKRVPLDGDVLYKLAGYYKMDFTTLLKAAFNQKYIEVRGKFPGDE